MDINGMWFDTVADQQVVINAIAHNAKAGAVVMTNDGEIIYVFGIEEWDEHILGKRVEIKGILTKRKVYPEVVKNGNGAVSQGLSGEQFVIELETYLLLED